MLKLSDLSVQSRLLELREKDLNSELNMFFSEVLSMRKNLDPYSDGVCTLTKEEEKVFYEAVEVMKLLMKHKKEYWRGGISYDLKFYLDREENFTFSFNNGRKSLHPYALKIYIPADDFKSFMADLYKAKVLNPLKRKREQMKLASEESQRKLKELENDITLRQNKIDEEVKRRVDEEFQKIKAEQQSIIDKEVNRRVDEELQKIKEGLTGKVNDGPVVGPEQGVLGFNENQAELSSDNSNLIYEHLINLKYKLGRSNVERMLMLPVATRIDSTKFDKFTLKVTDIVNEIEESEIKYPIVITNIQLLNKRTPTVEEISEDLIIKL